MNQKMLDARRKILKKNNIWKSELLFDHLGRECVYCGSGDKLHVHHIIPIKKGGLNILANLEVVCRLCHKEIHKQLDKVLPNEKPRKSFETMAKQYEKGRYKRTFGRNLPKPLKRKLPLLTD